MKKILRPMLGHLRRVLSVKVVRETPDVAKAVGRAVREIPEHYRDVKKERAE